MSTLTLRRRTHPVPRVGSDLAIAAHQCVEGVEVAERVEEAEREQEQAMEAQGMEEEMINACSPSNRH